MPKKKQTPAPISHNEDLVIQSATAIILSETAHETVRRLASGTIEKIRLQATDQEIAEAKATQLQRRRERGEILEGDCALEEFPTIKTMHPNSTDTVRIDA